jgi:4-amino-4-deoxy-L-arabinose transferase-like glycosyltransferase
MKLSSYLNTAVKFLDRYKLVIIGLAFLVFAAYRISRQFGAFGTVGWLDSPGVFSPGFLDVLAFSLAVVFFFGAYRFSFGMEEKKRLVLLFVAAFLMVAGFTQLSQPGWVDAQGYYDLASLGAERGPLYLVQNYHTLNTAWSEEVKLSIEDELRGFGIYEWGVEMLRPEVGETNEYASRTSQHPPLWPVILSLFMLVFGVSELTAFVVTWGVIALAVVVAYLVMKRLAGQDIAIKLAYILAVLPVILLSNTSPLAEGLVTLFVFLSIYFLVSEKNIKRSAFLSGVFLSLAFYTKFTVVFLYPLFFVLLLIRKGIWDSIKRFVILVVPCLIVTGIFMALNYFFMLTLITAKASLPFKLQIAVKSAFLSAYVLPAYYLVYFSIPVVFLMVLVFLGVLGSRKGRDEIAMLVLGLSLIGFMFLYPNKLGLERYALPYFLVVLLFFSRDLGRYLKDYRFAVLVLILTLVQGVLFLV